MNPNEMEKQAEEGGGDEKNAYCASEVVCSPY